MRTHGLKVGRFLENYCVHPKGARFGQPFTTYTGQQQFLNEAFRVKAVNLADVDERERVIQELGEEPVWQAERNDEELLERVYRLILKGVPRGNGKTPEAAGIGLYETMERRDAPEVFNVAGAKDQAALLTGFAKAFVERGPNGTPGKLTRWLDVNARSVVHRETHGVMRLLSSAGSLQHGLSVSVAIVDELHAILTAEQVETYNALWTALHKRWNAYLLAITTAGFSKATLLGQMYDQALETLELEHHRHVPGIGPCLTIGRDEANGILLWWYGPPEKKENGDTLEVDEALANEELWRAVNPAPWVTMETLRKQLAGLGFDELDFARLHLNMWTTTRDVFIPAAAWNLCRRPSLELTPKAPTWVGADVGITHDTTAVSWSQPVMLDVVDEDGKVVQRKHTVSRVRVWSARPEHEHDRTACHVWVPGGRVDLEDVHDFILELAREFRLKELVYDPYFFEGEAQRLAKRGIKLAPLFQHAVLPQIAYQALYRDVLGGLHLHDGDRVVNAHVAATAGRKTERGWKIYKLAQSPERRPGETPDRPIDATPATAYSSWRAMLQSGSVYTGRGLASASPNDDVDDDDDDDEPDD